MSAEEKSEVISRVEETQWGKRKLLTQLQVPKSTYYRWRARALQGKQDSSTASTRILLATSKSGTLLLRRDQGEMAVL